MSRVIDGELVEPVVRTLPAQRSSSATELMARAMVHGTQCTGDFTTADHLALAALPLAEVRAQFGIPPLDE